MVITMENFTAHTDELFAQIEDEREPIVVERSGENMVVLAQIDYSGIMETLHQLSSPVNERLVDEALAELRSGGGHEYKIGSRKAI
jgi:PHD/YefM family antitoxin component YafN of YafNO toxin-antitoxin module